ncbi:MAG: glycosyltransferase family 39 protein [Rhodocyclales bacterium]|nr:glycosyltransferase family 39 protein [Rhodocyclales bacterium]
MPSLPEPNRRHALYVLLALALSALSLVAHLNLTLLSGIHEARVLETGREMLELHNWVVPHFIGELRLEKPPLPYWASALAYKMAGEPSVTAARLVTALLGLLMLLASWLIARAVSDRHTALLVLPVLAGFLLFNTEFRKVTTDPFLAALTTAAVAAFAWAFRRPGRSGTACLSLAYLFTALALLAKGPIALVFIGIGAGFVKPRAADSVRIAWQWHALGVILACAPIAGWAAMVMQQLPDALALWRHEVWGRVTGDVEEMRGRWFYFPVMLSAVSPLLLPFLAGTFRGLRQRDPMALWLASGMVFLLLLSSRKAAYLLPLMAPAALLTAQYLSKMPHYREAGWLGWAQLLINLLLIAALFGAALAWRDHLSWGAASLGLLLLLSALALLRNALRARPSVASLVVSGVLITTFYNGVLQTHLPEDRTIYNLSAYINEHVPARIALYQQGSTDPRLAFYLNRLPTPIEDARLGEVGSPAWLLRRDPLPDAAGSGWQAVLQTQSRKGKIIYLYQR